MCVIMSDKKNSMHPNTRLALPCACSSALWPSPILVWGFVMNKRLLPAYVLSAFNITLIAVSIGLASIPL